MQHEFSQLQYILIIKFRVFLDGVQEFGWSVPDLGSSVVVSALF